MKLLVLTFIFDLLLGSSTLKQFADTNTKPNEVAFVPRVILIGELHGLTEAEEIRHSLLSLAENGKVMLFVEQLGIAGMICGFYAPIANIFESKNGIMLDDIDFILLHALSDLLGGWQDPNRCHAAFKRLMTLVLLDANQPEACLDLRKYSFPWNKVLSWFGNKMKNLKEYVKAEAEKAEEPEDMDQYFDMFFDMFQELYEKMKSSIIIEEQEEVQEWIIAMKNKERMAKPLYLESRNKRWAQKIMSKGVDTLPVICVMGHFHLEGMKSLLENELPQNEIEIVDIVSVTKFSKDRWEYKLNPEEVSRAHSIIDSFKRY